MAGPQNMVVQIIGEFTDRISPQLSQLTTQNIPALVGALAGIAATAVTGYMAQMVKEAINVGDAFNDLSERTGVAVETLSGLATAAHFGDASLKDMASGFTKLSQNLVAAQDGTSKQAALFAKLGIATKDANGNIRSADAVMADLADRFAGTANDANKINVAMEAMGKAGKQLIPVLNGGSEALKEYKKLGEDLGTSWTAEQAAEAGKFNDAIDTLLMALDGLWQIVAKDLLPKLAIMAEALAESAKEGGLLRNVLDGVAELISGPVGAAFDFLATIASTIGFAFNVVGKSIGGVSAALVAMMSGDLKVAKGIMAEMDADIKKTFEDYKAFNGKIWSVPTPGSGEAEDPKPTIGDTGEAAAKQLKEYQKALSDLQKELFAVDAAGKEVDVTWQTMHGEFKDFTASQKAMLIQKAAEIDITKQLLDLETSRVKTAADREKKTLAAWTATGALDIADKTERDGWLAAESQRMEKMAEFAAKEVEIRKLGPKAQAAALAELEEQRKKYARNGEEWQMAKNDGEQQSISAQKAAVWTDALVKNRDAYQRLNLEVKEYNTMLKIGEITQEQYTELMDRNRRATEDLTASQSRANMAYYEVVTLQKRAVEDLKIREEAINKAYADGNITLAEKTLRLREVKDQMANMNPIYAIDQVQKLEDTIKSAAASFEGMFDDYIFNAMEGKWQNLGEMIRKQISSMIAQMIAARLQFALFGDMGSTPAGKTPSSTGMIGSAFASFFGGFRENGGPVSAGKAYIVGEKRPEVFIPSVNGSIASSVESVAGGAQGPQTMNISISALDGADVMKVLSGKKRELAQMMNTTNRNYNLG